MDETKKQSIKSTSSGGRCGDSEHDKDLPKPKPTWGAIHSGTAADYWNQNLNAVMQFLSDRNVPWRVVHLGKVEDEAAVAIVYDEDGGWDKAALEADLRRLFLPATIFPRGKVSRSDMA
ncbi:hypothetical protein TWF718_003009 [Orbilia javanica]|uniref:Uncharacterized protein n=1 Tax=Orbilia javanica TaxID=47235 RepID=A0AAN8MPQ6_9PEZI